MMTAARYLQRLRVKKILYWGSVTIAVAVFFYMYFVIWIPSWPFVQKHTEVKYINAVHREVEAE